jgi:hypothetical protein
MPGYGQWQGGCWSSPNALTGASAGLGEEAIKAGVLIENGGLLPMALGARVPVSAEKLAPQPSWIDG